MDKTVRIQIPKGCPETGGMITVLEMAEFVEDNVADKMGFKKEQFLVEVDTATG